MVTTTDRFDANRDRILRISAELFAKNGYHATGVAALSDAVKLGRGALYHYIGSKEALLYEICKTQVDAMNTHAQGVMIADYSAEALLGEMARGLLRNIADHRNEWGVFFRDYSALTGDRRDEVFAARERYESYWRQALDRGVKAGVLRHTPELLVKGILGMLNYTYLWFEPDGKVSPEELADFFMDILFQGIRARPS